MYNPTRQQARDFFYTAWAHYRDGAPLSELERVVVAIVAMHPEYHRMLEADELTIDRDRDYTPEQGDTNPFLHLGLHLSIAEQLATDRPQGIRAEFERLTKKYGAEHAALHDLLECLGETMWQAQRASTAPDADGYLECVRQKA